MCSITVENMQILVIQKLSSCSLTLNFFICSHFTFYLRIEFSICISIWVKRFFFFLLRYIILRYNRKFIERVSLFNSEVDFFSGNVSSKIVYFRFIWWSKCNRNFLRALQLFIYTMNRWFTLWQNICVSSVNELFRKNSDSILRRIGIERKNNFYSAGLRRRSERENKWIF